MYSLSPQACSCFAAVVAAGAPELTVDISSMRTIRIYDSFHRSDARWWQIPILRSLSPRTTAGICLGDDIFVGDRSLLHHWPLLVHELTHWLQYRRVGTAGFLAAYAGEFLWRLPRASSPRDAYLKLSWEVQARRVESFASAAMPEYPWLLSEPSRRQA